MVQTVIETSPFRKAADKLFSDDELKGVIDTIASNPQIGDEIPGMGGIRKVRFGAKGKGKRGGSRVIFRQ